MDILESIGTVGQIKEFLFNNNANQSLFQELIVNLGAILTTTTKDEEYRKELASRDEIWNTFSTILNDNNIETLDEPKLTKNLRLLRGILLLARNLSTICMKVPLITVLKSLEKFNELGLKEHNIHNAVLIAYLQLLSNLSQINEVQLTVENFRTVFFTDKDAIINHIEGNNEMELPFYIFINEAFKNSDVLYDLLSENTNYCLLELLVKKGKELQTVETITNKHNILILALEKVFVHESFNKYIKTVDYMSEYFLDLLRVSQILITSKDDWNNYQTTALLAWIYHLFTTFSRKSIFVLTSKIFDPEELSAYHARTIRLLDCITELGKFNSTIQFLEHYDAIVELINLLRAVHENVERKTIKSKKNNENDEAGKSFPEVKSLIVEIIAYLSHESPKMQDKVRDLHGLELVLSNCMLDDNEPYIKERAIICIKFLLQENKQNQNFVAQLEAKQTYDDSVLKEVGYEVKIEDGNVKLKQTEEIKNIANNLQQDK